MPLAFLLDENLPAKLARAIVRHNASGGLLLDVLRVGDVPDLPLASEDPAILSWSERAGRILLSLDEQTMPGHLADHLKANHSSPGVFLIRPNVKVSHLIEYLLLIAHASEADEWLDRITYIP